MGSWVEWSCGELVLGRVHVGWELGRDRVLGGVGSSRDHFCTTLFMT